MRSTILAVGGLLAALVGSLAVEMAPWASRVMLVANVLVLLVSGWEWARERRGGRAWHEARPGAFEPEGAGDVASVGK